MSKPRDLTAPRATIARMRRRKLVISLEVGTVALAKNARRVKRVEFEDGSWVGNNPDDEAKCLRGHVGTIEQVAVNVVQPVKASQ